MGKPKGTQRVKLGVMTCTGRKRLGWNGGKTGRASAVRIIMENGKLVNAGKHEIELARKIIDGCE